MKNFIKKFALVFSLFLLIGVGDAEAARFSLSPSAKQFKTGCEVAVNIMMDSEGQSVSAADAFVYYNANEIEIIDQNTASAGVQVRPGNIFNAYVGNIVKPAEGKIYLTAFNLFSYYQTQGAPDVYGAIILKAKPGVTSSTLRFDFTLGNTIDSNIADPLSNDILTSVADGTYTFVPGSCVDDTTPPRVVSSIPESGDKSIALDSNLSFDIADSGSGVDINSVLVNLDSNVYKNGDSAFSFTGTPALYTVTINPSSNFLAATPVFVQIDAEDLSLNKMPRYEFSFNEPIVDSVSPYVVSPLPSPGSRGVALDSNVSFHIKDDLSGVDLSTVFVTIDGVEYKNGDSNFIFSGDNKDYFIVIDPFTNFPQDLPVEVVINGTDMDGNKMSPPYTFSFNHVDLDNVPPYVLSPKPASGATAIPLYSDISFNIRDNFSGVNIDSVIVEVDGNVYKNGDSGFSYSGNTKDYAVVINPIQDFPARQRITVNIDAVDLRGNVMTTFVYHFNEPSICGNNIVEDGEDCEPPGIGSCTDECVALSCELPVGAEAVCGNGVVEEGEGCEPPGTLACNDTCNLLIETVSQIQELIGLERLSDDEKTVLQELSLDTDLDGLPDFIERRYNTNLNTDDSDGDGISDLEEILDYGTDPNDSLSYEMHTRIVNWKDGDITGSPRLFVKGVAPADKRVEVFAISEDGVKFFLGETIASRESKFAVFSGINLDQGNYLLVADSYEDNGILFDRSLPVSMTIDFAEAVPAPTVESIDDVPVVQGVEIEVFGSQPVVFGTTVPNSQVFVVFESSIISSTVVSDSSSGFFTVFAPRPLELGQHSVTVYAITPDGIMSEPVLVGFRILDTFHFLEQFNRWLFIILLLAIMSILGAIYWYYKEHQVEKEIKKQKKQKELFDKSIVDAGVKKRKEL